MLYTGRTDFPQVSRVAVYDERVGLIGHSCFFVVEEVCEYDQAKLYKHLGLDKPSARSLQMHHGPNGHGTCVMSWFELVS